jgi:hypothetical protein
MALHKLDKCRFLISKLTLFYKHLKIMLMSLTTFCFSRDEMYSTANGSLGDMNIKAFTGNMLVTLYKTRLCKLHVKPFNILY